ncbi:MAG: hypothetical protein OXU20_22220 [Myxococcales bacterium]|nr:hypothetical protein [Myxococcales bacterium]
MSSEEADSFARELKRRVLAEHDLAVPSGDELLLVAAVQYEMLQLAQRSLMEAQAESIEALHAATTARAEEIHQRARKAAIEDRTLAAQSVTNSVVERLEQATNQLLNEASHGRRWTSRAVWTSAGFATLTVLVAAVITAIR